MEYMLDGRPIDQFIFEKVMKKATNSNLLSKTLADPNQDSTNNNQDFEKQYEVFKKMPKHIRIELEKDIMIAIA